MDDIFNFNWQGVVMKYPDPQFHFDRETLSELRATPTYAGLRILYFNIQNRTTKNGFILWGAVFFFIIFAFEQLTICDIKDEFEIVYSKLNEIYSIPEYVFMLENELYDVEINKFLGKLRMKNLQKTFNIKSATFK